MKITFPNFIENILRTHDKYGRQASILFNDIDFDDSQNKYLRFLLTKYLKTIFEQQNVISFIICLLDSSIVC